MRCEMRLTMESQALRSRLFCLLVLLALLVGVGRGTVSAQFCGTCGGPCGFAGSCIPVGNTCVCSGDVGACGPPACSSTLCAAPQTCNPSTCMCEAPGTPPATPTATATATPGGPCGSCGGPCGTSGFGICVSSGNTCFCSGDAGPCGPPVCTSSSLCAPGQTCNPSSCTCEGTAPTPTATQTATPSVTPSSLTPGTEPAPALTPPMIGVSILALALVALLAWRKRARVR